MKIAIATAGRYHLLDLARELAALGHEVTFYSYTPVSMCEGLGLDRRYVADLFFVNRVIEYLCRRLNLSDRASQAVRGFNGRLMDRKLARRLRPCDVLVAMADTYVKTLYAARRKYGATILVERPCKHIEEQYAILARIPGAKTPTKNSIRRELEGYAAADYVVVGAEHAKRSFLERGFPASKLFTNPYGTSLAQFHPTPKPGEGAYEVIMVGTWMYRKGCDLLAAACLDVLGVRLLHVGAVGDCPLPSHPLFTHVDPVPQARLIDYYAQARVFALASHEEGLALVQAQAIACGLPVVCTRDTGGADLARLLNCPEQIAEIPETTVECLADHIRKALAMAQAQPEGPRDYAGKAIENLSWQAYGRRWNEFLSTLEK